MKLVELQNAYAFGYDAVQEMRPCGDAMRLDLKYVHNTQVRNYL